MSHNQFLCFNDKIDNNYNIYNLKYVKNIDCKPRGLLTTCRFTLANDGNKDNRFIEGYASDMRLCYMNEYLGLLIIFFC
jgi:hypothetical protein